MKKNDVALFGLCISLFLENLYYLLFKFTLYQYFALFCCPAHAATGFQQATELFYIFVAADEILDNGYGLAATVVLLNAHPELLLLLGQGLGFLLFIGGILEVGIC